MGHIVDQDTGSVIAFIVAAIPDIPCYYQAVPAGFTRPSIYFPEPELETFDDTLDSFGIRYTMRPHFFGRTAREGQMNAKAALYALARSRFLVPLLEGPDGTETGYALDVSKPATVRQTDDKPGAAIFTLTWEHRERYPEEPSPKARRLILSTRLKDFDFDTLLNTVRGA